MGKSYGKDAPRAPETVGDRTLRSMFTPVFLPALIYEIGNGAVIPVIALTALQLDASTSEAASMLAILGIGRMVGDIPASALADRVGDRRAMIIAAAFAVVALFGCLVAPSLAVLSVCLALLGMCNATFVLARYSYLAEMAPVALRARALSTLAGSHRIGRFIGPFVGGAAIGLTQLRAAYVVAMAAVAAAALVLVLVPDVEAPSNTPVMVRGGISSRAVLTAHRRLFATLGLAILVVGAVRAARDTVLPLWAAHLGLNAWQTSLIFGLAGAVDMAMFYPAGKIMDHFGRLMVALPAMIILGTAVMSLTLTVGIASLTAVAMVMGFGNGIGSGITMTLGADAAPRDGRVRFLGIWRLLGDCGNAAGPVVVAVLATTWTLAVGIVTIGAAGLVAAAGLAVWVPRYSAVPNRKAVRERAKQQADEEESVLG